MHVQPNDKMNKIIEFLRNYSETGNIKDNSIDKSKLSISFNDLKKALSFYENNKNNVVNYKRNPEKNKGQIWLCKQEYYDALGNKIRGNVPFLVYIVSKVDKIEDEPFVRVMPVSPFTEFNANDEIIVNDKSVTGFEFTIETWNEQPVLTKLLDEFAGEINVKIPITEKINVNLSETQKEFRKAEIRNTAYLRQSVNSLLEFKEITKEKKVFFNIDNSILFPKPENKENQTIGLFHEPAADYLSAGRKGNKLQRQTYLFEKTVNDTNVIIKIFDEGNTYILSIIEPENIELLNSKMEKLKQSPSNLYTGLESGLYFIKVNDNENKIRIIIR